MRLGWCIWLRRWEVQVEDIQIGVNKVLSARKEKYKEDQYWPLISPKLKFEFNLVPGVNSLMSEFGWDNYVGWGFTSPSSTSKWAFN